MSKSAFSKSVETIATMSMSHDHMKESHDNSLGHMTNRWRCASIFLIKRFPDKERVCRFSHLPMVREEYFGQKVLE